MERTLQERGDLDRQIADLTGVWLGRGAIGNRPYDDLLAEAQKRQARQKRRAGVRALERKYGHDSAARIVKKYTGQTIQ